MPDTTVTFPMGGGLNRDTASHLSNPEDFWDLVNMRPSKSVAGAIETAPRFTLQQTISAGTVWNGSTSTTESIVGDFRGAFYYSPTKYLLVGAETIRAGTQGALAQQQVYQQSVSVGTSATPTLQTGCLLRINSLTGLAITLGSTLDIEIDGATTFKWRKNGGAWTTLVAIAGSVSIDGGNATVYFLTTTGFTIGHWWKWTRTDTTYLTAFAASAGPVCASFASYEGSVYFNNGNALDIWAFLTNTSLETYVISAGYRPFGARYIASFANHLIAVGYYSNPTYNLDAPIALASAVGWSDRDNFDNFIANDVNEADIFYFPHVVANPLTSNVSNVLLAHEINGRLFVVLDNAIWVTSYLGLPVVFNFEHFVWTGTTNARALGNVIGLFNRDDIFLFDGNTLQNLPGLHLSYPNNIIYDAMWLQGAQEFCFISTSFAHFYQIPTRRWYTRNISIDTTYGPLLKCSKDFTGDRVLMFGTSYKVYADDINNELQPVYDSAFGTAYGTAKLTKHVFHGGSFLQVKELLGLIYVHAQTSSSPSSTYYSTVANAWLKVFYRLIAPLTLEVDMPTSATDASLTWKTTNNFDDLSGPRVAFRGVALELQAFGNDSGKPPMGLTVYGIEALVRGYDPVHK